MKRKFYTFTTPWGAKKKVYLTKTRYADDTLAVAMMTEGERLYSMVTVNLADYGAKPGAANKAFVKNCSESEGMEAFLKESKLATPTGVEVETLFTTFKEYEFQLSKLS